MYLSIATTMYRSAPHLEEFHRRASAAASLLTDSYEIVLVNDGSPDNSLDVALDLLRGDPRLRVVDLSRNFGHHKAIMTGLEHASGELVFLIDCDLEEAPELVVAFHEKLRQSRGDVVYGVQRTRKGGLFERISGEIFYAAFNYLSSYPVPRNQVTARLMTRRYTQALTAHKEREIFLGGLWAITGFVQIPFVVDKLSKGTSTYTLRRKAAIMLNSVTSFSTMPLLLVFYLGCVIMLLSGSAALYLVVRRLFFGVLLTGWPSLIVSVWLLGGLTLFSLGIIGMYLSKVFMETKQRPYIVVRQVYEQAEAAGERTEHLAARGPVLQ